MAARRLILIMLLMLMVSSFAAALVPPPEREEDSTSTPATGAEETQAGAPRLLERELDAAARRHTVQARLGDQLVLTVSANRADDVEIPALGEFQPVDPDLPAVFDLVPFEVRRYAVRLAAADRTIGWLEVREAPRPRTGSSGRDPRDRACDSGSRTCPDGR